MKLFLNITKYLVLLKSIEERELIRSLKINSLNRVLEIIELL